MIVVRRRAVFGRERADSHRCRNAFADRAPVHECVPGQLKVRAAVLETRAAAKRASFVH